jgi:hypothetical protein
VVGPETCTRLGGASSGVSLVLLPSCCVSDRYAQYGCATTADSCWDAQWANPNDPMYGLDPIHNIMVSLNGGWPASRTDRPLV